MQTFAVLSGRSEQQKDHSWGMAVEGIDCDSIHKYIRDAHACDGCTHSHI